MSKIAMSSENHVSMRSSIVLIQYNQFVSKFINLIQTFTILVQFNLLVFIYWFDLILNLI